MKFTRCALFILMALLGACQSVDWNTKDPLHGVQWRDRTAFVFDLDVVLAGDRSSAKQAIQQVWDLRAKLKSELGQELGPMIWVSMGPQDQALAKTPQDVIDLLGAASKPILNGAPLLEPLGSAREDEPGVRQYTEEERSLMMAWMIRAQAFPIDLDGNRLEFPLTITQHSNRVFLYPTDSGLRSVASALLNLSLSVRDFSIVESMAIGLMRSKLVKQLSKELGKQRQQALHGWLVQELELTITGEDSQSAKLAQILKVEFPRKKSEPKVLSLIEFMELPTTLFPENHETMAIDWTAYRVKLPLHATFDTYAFIRKDFTVDARMGRAPGATSLFTKGTVQRNDLDWLFDQLENSEARTLLRAPTQGLAAATATLYAIERQAYTSEAAQLLWASYGMQPIQDLSFETLSKFF